MKDSKLKSRRAIVAGGSGLTGNALLKCLLADEHFDEILSLGRSPSGLQNAKLVEKRVDFSDELSWAEDLSAEVLFCCLGTTRQKSGSAEAFRKVDFDYVRKLARLCIYRGIPKFSVLSSHGADLKSPFLYFRTKAEMEAELFNLPLLQLDIFRPSLLVGDREEKRFFESLAIRWSPLLSHFISGFRPCPVSTLAQFMLDRAKEDRFQKRIFDMDQILGLAPIEKD